MMSWLRNGRGIGKLDLPGLGRIGPTSCGVEGRVAWRATVFLVAKAAYW